MRKSLLALAMAPTLAAPALAQPIPTAQGPDTGKARTTPSTTVIPGSSTTGNATGPGGAATAAEPTLPHGTGALPQGQGGTGATTSPVIPSPAQ